MQRQFTASEKRRHPVVQIWATSMAHPKRAYRETLRQMWDEQVFCSPPSRGQQGPRINAREITKGGRAVKLKDELHPVPGKIVSTGSPEWRPPDRLAARFFQVCLCTGPADSIHRQRRPSTRAVGKSNPSSGTLYNAKWTERGLS